MATASTDQNLHLKCMVMSCDLCWPADEVDEKVDSPPPKKVESKEQPRP